jgi:polyribonucleotide nucleotidyltransferase
MKLFMKVKAASYDKIYAIASKGSAKKRRSTFEEVKEEVKRCLLKKNWQQTEI